jgi:N-acetylmuramoyl-L-alanine amidase
VILLDPGHGGEELGAVAKVWKINEKNEKYLANVYEKDLALILTKKIAEILKKNQHNVYLTRSMDVTLGLEKRAELADAVKADLIVSVHFNSALDNTSGGFETYYLDNHKDAAVKKLESAENILAPGEDAIINQILIDLVIGQTVTASKEMANIVHETISKKIAKKYNLKDRGVRPGLFFVLALSKRPGILVEVGFLSNPKEVPIMRSTNFLNDYAEAIAEGIDKYIKKRKSEKPLRN